MNNHTLAQQLLTALAKISGLDTLQQVAEFTAEALLKLPGLAACRLCLVSLPEPVGNLPPPPCLNCPTWLAPGNDPPGPCSLAEQPDLHCFPLQSESQLCGYLLLRPTSGEALHHLSPLLTTFSQLLTQELQHRRQKQQLQQQLAHFELALKDSSLVIFTQDTALRYTWIYNPHPSFNPAAVLGKTEADLLPPAEAARLINLKRRVIDTGQSAQTEVQTTLNGQLHYYDLAVEPLYDEDQQIVGLRGIASDITRRKQIEQELSANEKLLRQIAANYPKSFLSIIEKDLTVGFTAGQEFAKLNLDPNNFVGLTLEQVFGEHAALVKENYLQTFNGVEREFELFMNNQHQLYRTVPLLTADGRIERILVVVTNETERKQDQAKIAHLNAILRAIRNVNQLIIHEKNPQRLIEQTCHLLTETRGYQHAWIALFEGKDKRLIAVAEAGFDEAFKPMSEYLQQGYLVSCLSQALAQPGIIEIKNTLADCPDDCPLASHYQPSGAASIRLEHEGTVYGILTVALPASYLADAEERALFEEVAGDIAFALHSLQQEERRQQAEAALQRSEQELRLVMDNTPTMIFSIDSHYRLITANAAFKAATASAGGREIAKGEVVLAEAYPAEFKALWRGYYDRALSGEHFTVETSVQWADGLHYLDGRRQVVHQNPALAKILQLPPADLAAKQYEKRSYFWADGAPMSPEEFPSIRAFNEQRPIQNVEIGIHTESGKQIWVNATAMPVDLPDWKVIVTVVDITERKQAEESLRQLNQALEQSPVSVMITDTAGVIQYVNPGFVKVTGYSAAEAIGQNPRMLQSGKHQPEFYRNLWATLTAGQVWQGEFHNRKKNDELYWELASIAGVKDKNGKISHYVAVNEDITRRKQLEEETRQQQRLVALGQLAAGIAHDFNNMLTAIMGYAELLKFEPNVTASAQSDLERIVKQSKRAAQLIRQILDFSRQSPHELKPLDLKVYLNETLKFVQRTIPETIQVQFNFSGDNFFINADPTQLQQVITNLAVNARDAMPHGGKLYFNLGRLTLRADEIPPHPDMQPGEWVTLAVTDTGEGIAPEVLPHIFDPFFTTKKVGEGTGLGLSQVYGLIQQHKGCLTVTSQPKQGTTFTLYWPALKTALASPTSVAEVIPKGQGETILLVEDDQVVLEITRSLLERLNYHVLTARDGLEALSVYQAHLHQIALILTDAVMPQLDGLGLAQALQQYSPPPKVVFMSGYSSELEIEPEMIKQDIFSNWLQKPLNVYQLAKMLQQTLR